jgi:hypothetical protein
LVDVFEAADDAEWPKNLLAQTRRVIIDKCLGVDPDENGQDLSARRWLADQEAHARHGTD